MDVEWADRRLRERFEMSAEGTRAWGPQVARRYILRVNFLLEADDWAAVLAHRALRAHPLHGPSAGAWSIVLHDRWRLVVTYDEQARRVRIEEVSNHYGD
ncbi:MAG: hypothetical protein ACKVT1_19370 [Dehalococcoidia bacterium]